MERFLDDRNRELRMVSAPKRIVSLVPSDTLSLCDLGYGHALVGRTDYCELPKHIVSNVPSVGGTKNAKSDAILALEPDLVLANQEENTFSILEPLVKANVQVYVAFPKTVEHSVAHLAKLARIFRLQQSAEAKDVLKRAYAATVLPKDAATKRAPLRIFCPIWIDPLMTIHGETYISSVIERCGGVNVFRDRERKYPLAADLGAAEAKEADGRDVRYPRVSLDEVAASKPDLILLPDEPYAFGEKDVAFFRTHPGLKNVPVEFCSGKDLSWYGSRVIEGIGKIRAIFEKHGPQGNLH